MSPEYAAAILCAIIGYTVVSLFFRWIPKFNRKKDQKHSDGTSKKSEKPESPFESDNLKWFEVLNVAETASADEIKIAYRAKINSYHPDRVATLGPEFRILAEEKSKIINEAYRVAMLLKR